MRHEQIYAKDSYAKVDVSEIRAGAGTKPVATVVEMSGEAAQFLPTPAAPDIPATVGGMIAASYAALIGAFAIATVGSSESIFAIVVSALFVAIFFTVPRIFFAVEPRQITRSHFGRFMEEGIQTHTGHCSGKAALVQMMIVPVFLTAAVLVMGIAAAVIL